MVELNTYVYVCISNGSIRSGGAKEGPINREMGLMEAFDPLEALEIVVGESRFGNDLSEADIFVVTKKNLDMPDNIVMNIGNIMLARYLDSFAATRAAAPDGKWEYNGDDLYVNDTKFSRRTELYEKVA